MDSKSNENAVVECPGCRERDRRIADLESRLAKLEEQLARLSRAGKRQAAPFSKAPPKADPKPPGRKSGENYGTHTRRAIPDQIDETHEAPLPQSCPGCGGDDIRPTGVAQQYQVEIPRRPIHRQFNVHVGECRCCGKRVQGRHPFQTSDALGAAASQIGPEAQALAVHLNKQAGLSWGKVRRLFKDLFDIRLSRGGACRIMLRSGDRCQSNYQAIVQRVQSSPWIVPDETGWRIGGSPAWLHVAVGQDAVAFLIDRQRGYDASAKLIGADYAGTMIHDGWSPYRRFLHAAHQTCLAHLLRRCREMLEVATRGAVIFPRRVKALLKESLAVRDRRDTGELSAATAAMYADDLQGRMENLVRPVKANAANERLAEHLWNNGLHLFTFLRQTGIDATNWRAEQAIRPAVVNRKVWGGNRTAAGAEAQSRLMTVLETASRRGMDTMRFMADLLCAQPTHRPLLIPNTG
jgi:transposase